MSTEKTNCNCAICGILKRSSTTTIWIATKDLSLRSILLLLISWKINWTSCKFYLPSFLSTFMRSPTLHLASHTAQSMDFYFHYLLTLCSIKYHHFFLSTTEHSAARFSFITSQVVCSACVNYLSFQDFLWGMADCHWKQKIRFITEKVGFRINVYFWRILSSTKIWTIIFLNALYKMNFENYVYMCEYSKY